VVGAGIAGPALKKFSVAVASAGCGAEIEIDPPPETKAFGWSFTLVRRNPGVAFTVQVKVAVIVPTPFCTNAGDWIKNPLLPMSPEPVAMLPPKPLNVIACTPPARVAIKATAKNRALRIILSSRHKKSQIKPGTTPAKRPLEEHYIAETAESHGI
jgi:hypothetical protein